MGKLTGKPVAFTIADCESEARRIQLPNHVTGVSPCAAESKTFRRLHPSASLSSQARGVAGTILPERGHPFREDVSNRRGIKGAEADIPERRRKLSSLWRITVKTRMSGSLRASTGFRARAIPCWLARSFQAKVLGCFELGGLPPKGCWGEAGCPNKRRNLASLWHCRDSGFTPVQPVKPVFNHKGYSLSFTRPTRPCVNQFVASATRRFFGRAWPIGHAQPVSP